MTDQLQAGPKRVGICYFTGTGNTEFIARELKAALEPEHRVELVNIELLGRRTDRTNLARFDLLILGAPVLAFNLPRQFARFISCLPAGRKRPAYLFLNAGGDRLADTDYACRLLSRRGYAVRGAVFFITVSNLLVRAYDAGTGKLEYGLLGWAEHRNVRQAFAACRHEIRAVARAIGRGAHIRSAMPGFARLFFPPLRWVFYNLACNLLRFHIRITRACNACAICVRSCPTRNIQLRQDRPRFGSLCTVCYRCLNICPRQAIRFRWPLGFAGNRVPYLAPGWQPPDHEATSRSLKGTTPDREV